MNLSSMEDKFRALWDSLEATGGHVATFQKLVEAYSEPPRVYHTLSHVGWGLTRIDEIVSTESLQVDVRALQWAMWFHDACMTFGKGSEDDEERSARLAYHHAREAGLSQHFGNKVMGLVLATSHLAEKLTLEEGILVDADLSILGASEGDFDVYESRVRQEWSHVGDRDFARGRSTVLLRFLKKRRIFTTDYGRGRWETRARQNLERSLRKLAVVR